LVNNTQDSQPRVPHFLAENMIMRFGKTAQLTLCFLVSVSSALANRACAQQQTAPNVLAGTELLDWEGDIASRLVEGADQFLLREIEQSVARRAAYWQRDCSSPAAYSASLEPNRQRLAHILGVRDERHEVAALELLATTAQSALVGENPDVQVFAAGATAGQPRRLCRGRARRRSDS
jgi:hypothetical protein